MRRDSCRAAARPSNRDKNNPSYPIHEAILGAFGLFCALFLSSARGKTPLRRTKKEKKTILPPLSRRLASGASAALSVMIDLSLVPAAYARYAGRPPASAPSCAPRLCYSRRLRLAA